MAAIDVIRQARESDDFRRELATGPHTQVVVMTLQPGEEIGEEVHEDADQILLFVEGTGEAILDGAHHAVSAEQLVLVPGGTRQLRQHGRRAVAARDDLRAARASARHGAPDEGRRRRRRAPPLSVALAVLQCVERYGEGEHEASVGVTQTLAQLEHIAVAKLPSTRR